MSVTIPVFKVPEWHKDYQDLLFIKSFSEMFGSEGKKMSEDEFLKQEAEIFKKRDKSEVVMTEIETIRKTLRTFVSDKEGRKLRKRLGRISKENYKPVFTDSEYMGYLAKHENSFERNGNQSSNEPYLYTYFDCSCQHVMGDSLKECLDKVLSKRGE